MGTTHHISQNEAAVRELVRAHKAGDIDAMLAVVHPDVVWQPLTRPGKSVYVGRDGIRQMVADVGRTIGPSWIEVESYAEAVDRVILTGALATSSSSVPVTIVMIMRNGLIYDGATRARTADAGQADELVGGRTR